MDPVQAMGATRQSSSFEVVMVRGSTDQYPADRPGCWILAGLRSLASATQILCQTAVERFAQVSPEAVITRHH
jgi:hypothetical protein